MKKNILYLTIFLFALFLFPIFIIVSIVIKNNGSSDEVNDEADSDKELSNNIDEVFIDSIEDLTVRQAEILEYIMSSENLTMADISLKFPSVTQRTLRRDLSAIEEKNLIKKHGKTKGATYSAVL